MILDKIQQLLNEVGSMSASSADEIEALRLKYLSKKGPITALTADFRKVPADQKKTVGMKINELKQTAIDRINAQKEQLGATDNNTEGIEITRSPNNIGMAPL